MLVALEKFPGHKQPFPFLQTCASTMLVICLEGCHGSGKSELLSEFSRRGYHVLDEVRHGLNLNGTRLPT